MTVKKKTFNIDLKHQAKNAIVDYMNQRGLRKISFSNFSKFTGKTPYSLNDLSLKSIRLTNNGLAVDYTQMSIKKTFRDFPTSDKVYLDILGEIEKVINVEKKGNIPNSIKRNIFVTNER